MKKRNKKVKHDSSSTSSGAGVSTESKGPASGAVNGNKGVIRDEALVKRHAGVIGLSACILAYPYSVPDFVPGLLMDLSDHMNDPQPIQVYVWSMLPPSPPLSLACTETGVGEGGDYSWSSVIT